MNHDLYYENGFFKTEIDDVTKKLLWNEIYNTEWIADGVENIYKEIPVWYQSKNKYNLNPDGSNRSQYERDIGSDILKNTPKSLIEIGLDLTQSSPFNFFKKYYRKAELQYIDLWNGSEEIPYHFDTINGADTLVLIYLTEQESWDKNWGGTITMKKQVGEKIHFEEEVLPNDGVMLIVNNANPLVYHKVSSLKNTSINRYTFSFIYRWF
jgi:hypothetical protein